MCICLNTHTHTHTHTHTPVAVPVAGKRNFGAAKALPSVTAAGEAELSGAASTVEEREKLVAVPVAGKRNFGAAKALIFANLGHGAVVFPKDVNEVFHFRESHYNTCSCRANNCHAFIFD